MPSPAEPTLAPCHYRVSRPYQQERQQQHEPRQNIKPTDFFKFDINVVLRTISLLNNSGSLRITSEPLLRHTSLYISCMSFFQQGQDFLRSKLAHPCFPPESLDQITQRVLSNVQQMFELEETGFATKPSYSSSHIHVVGVTFPLALDIVVDAPDVDVLREVMEESMQEFRMVPASKEAIQSLKKIKLMDTKVQCNICMEEFDDGSEDVSVMPCKHAFHQECIVRWLQTSHMCPLCRYPMPTANK